MSPVLAMLAAISLWLGADGARAGAASDAFYGPCFAQQVVTGDSVDVRCGNEVARVRLLNVAAPKPDAVGYTEASRALRQLLAGRELWLAFALPARPSVDGHGLLLAHLYDAQGRNLNVELVRLGWAAYSTEHGAGALAANFRAAQDEARASQRALWSVWSVTAGRAP